jgi:hypothetical protein
LMTTRTSAYAADVTRHGRGTTTNATIRQPPKGTNAALRPMGRGPSAVRITWWRSHPYHPGRDQSVEACP